MRYLFSIFVGAVTAVAGVFLHLSFPPVGLIVGLIGTATTFWALGRHFGKRRMRLVALISWALVVNQASKFGPGGELLIQGDRAGFTFLYATSAVVLISIFLPVGNNS